MGGRWDAELQTLKIIFCWIPLTSRISYILFIAIEVPIFHRRKAGPTFVRCTDSTTSPLFFFTIFCFTSFSKDFLFLRNLQNCRVVNDAELWMIRYRNALCQYSVTCVLSGLFIFFTFMFCSNSFVSSFVFWSSNIRKCKIFYTSSSFHRSNICIQIVQPLVCGVNKWIIPLPP